MKPRGYTRAKINKNLWQVERDEQPIGEIAALVPKRELGPEKPPPPASLKKTTIPYGVAMALGMAALCCRLA